MATKYFAIRKTSIDGRKFDAGEEITGVSETRLEGLRGRFVRTDADVRDRKKEVGKDVEDKKPAPKK